MPPNAKVRPSGVCFSELELYTVKFRTRQAGLPLSIYCHDTILEGVIKEPLKKEELEVLRNLSKMGNNLNQLTKTAKFLNAKRLEKEAGILLNEIQNVINKLSDDWKIVKGKSFKGCISYVLGNKGATILASEGALETDTPSIINSFYMQSLLNPKLGRCVGHIPLSFSSDDKERMTNHPHCHIVFNRVNNEGKTISDRNTVTGTKRSVNS